MTFVFRMALREVRASWRRLLFFFVCLAVGVGSIVAIRSTIQIMRVVLAQEAQAMLGADLLIASNTDLSPKVLEHLALERREGRLRDQVEAIELPTMVRPADSTKGGTRIVELKAVARGFPLRGVLTLQNGTYSHDLLRNRGALVRPEVLSQLGLRVGDMLAIGSATFTIRGAIVLEPGRQIGAFSLGPRVMIDLADLPATQLLGLGSRTSRQLLYRVSPELDVRDYGNSLRRAFGDEFIIVRSYRRSEDRMAANFMRAENYLSLVGFVILILGGIGVSSVTRIFVQQKIKSVAVLKCVGGTTRQMLQIYLAQVILLGFAGSVLGVLLAAGVIAMVPSFVADIIVHRQIEFGLTISAVLQGIAVGLAVSVLFALVPLLDIRHVKPSLLLRQDNAGGGSFDWGKWLTTGGVAVALLMIAAWQAGSARIALILAGGFVAVAIVLHGAGLLLIRAVQPLRFARSFALRQAMLHISRPGSQTGIILLAVGLGTFFILGVRGLQANLVRDFTVQVGPEAPDMFLLDVQADQREALGSAIDGANGEEPPPKLIPILRARVIGVHGREINLDNYQDVRGRGTLAREYTVTYRDALEANEAILEGRWWPSGTAGEAEVSIEESLQERFGIHPGDSMVFDVQGSTVTARVASIRQVHWQDFRAGGFMFVFRPGTFDRIPHTYVSTARGPVDPDARGKLLAALANRFPNVSVIDLHDVLVIVREVVDNVTLAVTIVGALVLFSGVLILIGAVSMTKFRRVYEAAILKTLGASTKLIATMLLLEYGLLGAIAGTVGAFGAIVLSWAIANYVLEVSWSPTLLLSFGGMAATTAFVATVGVVASLDVLRHKPLATLRAE